MALVVGGFVPPTPLDQQQMSAEKLNRIWSELAPAHGFTQLQMAPDGAMANFLGRTPEDGITIQPPVIQIRSTITGPAQIAAESAESMMAVILRHLGAAQFFNLGIRHIYRAPLPDNDARTFVLQRVLGRMEDDLGELAAGAETIWGGIKYVIQLPDRHYTVTVEPFQRDEMKSLYIDLDAQFQGEAETGLITSRARDAQDYLSGPVNRYLDELMELH